MDRKQILLNNAHPAKATTQHVPFAYTAIAALAPAILLGVIVAVASSMSAI